MVVGLFGGNLPSYYQRSIYIMSDGWSTSILIRELMQLYAAVTPAPVQRLEAFRIPDWERQGSNWRVPRSSLAPILRFADLDGFVQESPDGARLDAFIQTGIAREDQPHYLKIMARPDADTTALVEYGLGVISTRARTGGRHDHGVIAPVRTYEAPIDRRLEEAGFGVESTVTLLLKETVVRVAEPLKTIARLNASARDRPPERLV